MEKGEFEELIESLLDRDLHGGFIFIANELRDKLEEAKEEFLELDCRVMKLSDGVYTAIDKKQVDKWFIKWFGAVEGEG